MAPDRAACALPRQARKADQVACLATAGKSYLKLRKEGSFGQREGGALPVTALV